MAQIGTDDDQRGDNSSQRQLTLGLHGRRELERGQKQETDERREPQPAYIERMPAHRGEALIARRLKQPIIEGERRQQQKCRECQHDPKYGSLQKT